MLTSSAVNQLIARAVRHAGDFRSDPASHEHLVDDVRAQFSGLPDVLRPFALDELKNYAERAGDAAGRADAGLALEWLTTDAAPATGATNG